MNRAAESTFQASCFLGILLQGARLPAPLAASLSRVDLQALGVGAEQLAQVQSDRLKCHLHREALPDHPPEEPAHLRAVLYSATRAVFTLRVGRGFALLTIRGPSAVPTHSGCSTNSN